MYGRELVTRTNHPTSPHDSPPISQAVTFPTLGTIRNSGKKQFSSGCNPVFKPLFCTIKNNLLRNIL